MQGSKFDWKFHAQSNVACKAHKYGCDWPRGKILGGSSGTNGLIFVRGNDRDFNRWAAAGNFGWDWENVLYYYKKSEGNQYEPFVAYKNGRYHSATGPLKIDFLGESTKTDEIFLNAGKEFGITYVDDINADVALGFTNIQGTIYQGRRVSTAKAFLIPAMNRPNLHIIKHALVEKILLSNENRAYGVKFTINGKHKMKAFAKKEVVLCAGAVMSPVLLMLSGIGPKRHLQKHNIPVKADLAVGKNLIDHIVVTTFFTFNPIETEPTSPFDSTFNFAIHNTGPLIFGNILAANVNTRNDSAYPDFTFYPIYFTRNTVGAFLDSQNYNDKVKQQLNEINVKHDVVVVRSSYLAPKSRGRICLKSNSVHDKPTIKPNYLKDSDDVMSLIRAIKLQLSFLDTKAYRERDARFIKINLNDCDGVEFLSDNYLKCYLRYFTSTDYHPVGTSKMGPKTDRTAVVSPKLLVYNVKGLREIDAGM